MKPGSTTAHVVVFAVATALYAAVYAPDSLWQAAHERFGIFAMLLWVAVLPGLFGFVVHGRMGVPWATPIWVVVAAPIAAHAGIFAWYSMGPLPVRVEDWTIFATMIAAQVFFVHLGATLVTAQQRPRGS
ncbi:MAG: hypothetical protein QOD06_3102 [Candidatus Binatota bacterium]|jgi:hypothetical protein|nr:hypothetical protein [Candidatus Binatota bacterium]